MDDCDFRAVAQNTIDSLLVFAGDNSIAKTEMVNCIDEISSSYKRYYNRGLETNQISHILLEIAIAMMIASRDLDSAATFADYVRGVGDRTCKILARHWPPIDKENWPFDPKQWPAD